MCQVLQMIPVVGLVTGQSHGDGSDFGGLLHTSSSELVACVNTEQVRKILNCFDVLLIPKVINFNRVT